MHPGEVGDRPVKVKIAIMCDEEKEPEPSMSDIAKMIAAIDKKLDTKVEGVKNDLTKAISDQAVHFHKTLRNTIDESIEPISKKQEEMKEKSDERFANLEAKSDERFANLEATVANLTDLVKKSNTTIGTGTISQNENDFPALPPRASTAHPSASPSAIPASKPAQGQDPAITELIADARTVIGIGPIDKTDFEHFGQANVETAIRMAAIEALRLELNIKDHEIGDNDIASTFLPKGEPKIPRVYIKFHQQQHAELCLRLAKGLKNPEIKVFRYFPRQLQSRVRALENVAYPLRKFSNPPFKTEVVYTDSDVQLLVCPKGQVRYYPYCVTDLPPIDMAPIRSPPPGRQRRNKRNRSDSSSPELSRKSVRKASPNKVSDVEVDTSVTMLPTPASGLPTAVNDDDSIGTTPSSRPPPLSLPCPNPALDLDLGDFIDNQVVSPMTGKVKFNLNQPVNKRRMSLNM